MGCCTKKFSHFFKMKAAFLALSCLVPSEAMMPQPPDAAGIAKRYSDWQEAGSDLTQFNSISQYLPQYGFITQDFQCSPILALISPYKDRPCFKGGGIAGTYVMGRIAEAIAAAVHTASCELDSAGLIESPFSSFEDEAWWCRAVFRSRDRLLLLSSMLGNYA